MLVALTDGARSRRCGLSSSTPRAAHPALPERAPAAVVALGALVSASRNRYSPPVLTWSQYEHELGALVGLSGDELWATTARLHAAGVVHFASARCGFGALGALVVLDMAWLAQLLSLVCGRYCASKPFGLPFAPRSSMTCSAARAKAKEKATTSDIQPYRGAVAYMGGDHYDDDDGDGGGGDDAERARVLYRRACGGAGSCASWSTSASSTSTTPKWRALPRRLAKRRGASNHGTAAGTGVRAAFAVRCGGRRWRWWRPWRRASVSAAPPAASPAAAPAQHCSGGYSATKALATAGRRFSAVDARAMAMPAGSGGGRR